MDTSINDEALRCITYGTELSINIRSWGLHVSWNAGWRTERGGITKAQMKMAKYEYIREYKKQGGVLFQNARFLLGTKININYIERNIMWIWEKELSLNNCSSNYNCYS